jgi:hypothetical protein
MRATQLTRCAPSCPLGLWRRAQGVVVPLTGVAATVTAATGFVNHLFVWRLGMGMRGVALAYNLLQGLELALLLAAAAWQHFVAQAPDKRTWQGFSPQALKGWGGYLKVGAHPFQGWRWHQRSPGSACRAASSQPAGPLGCMLARSGVRGELRRRALRRARRSRCRLRAPSVWTGAAGGQDGRAHRLAAARAWRQGSRGIGSRSPCVVLCLCANRWVFEAVVLIAGVLPDAEVQLSAMGESGCAAATPPPRPPAARRPAPPVVGEPGRPLHKYACCALRCAALDVGPARLPSLRACTPGPGP